MCFLGFNSFKDSQNSKCQSFEMTDSNIFTAVGRYWSHNTEFRFHFYRYWFHITKSPYDYLKPIDPVFKIFKNTFHAFRPILIPHSRFSRLFQTGLHSLSEPVFSIIFKMFDVQNVELSQNRMFGNDCICVIIWRCFWCLKKNKFTDDMNRLSNCINRLINRPGNFG